MPATRRRRTDLQVAASERAVYLAKRLGTAVKERRQALGLRQVDVGERAGVSQRQVSRLEHSKGFNADLDMWAQLGAALGLEIAAFFDNAPGADLPRDMQHLKGQNLVIETSAPGGWAGTPEAAVPGDGARPRSIDVRLARAAHREVAVVEIWDLILDGGEVMRGLEAKVLAIRRTLPEDWRVHGLLVVRGTQRNRRLIGQLQSLFAARYPAGSAAWLRALGDRAVPMPAADGLVWTDVRGERLIAARLMASK